MIYHGMFLNENPKSSQQLTGAGVYVAVFCFLGITLTVCASVTRSRITAGSDPCLCSSSTVSRTYWPVTEITPSTVNWFRMLSYFCLRLKLTKVVTPQQYIQVIATSIMPTEFGPIAAISVVWKRSGPGTRRTCCKSMHRFYCILARSSSL